MPQSGTAGRVMQGVSSNTPLPPSVEAAYYRKCIELKRRINEIEESNDVMRARKTRVDRAVLKLRLERAFLLEQIKKRMELNEDQSDHSDSPPPTPTEKPLRLKRGHRKNTPPPPSLTTNNSGSTPAAPSGTATFAVNPQQPFSPDGAVPTHLGQYAAAASQPAGGPQTLNPQHEPVNGSAAAPPSLAGAPLPPVQRVTQYPENGETSGSDHRAPHANGDDHLDGDTEMGEAGAAGTGFTAVNR